MDLGLSGKVVLVTGASRGIGRAIALGFAEEGCRVALVARGGETLAAAANEVRGLGGEALEVVADLRIPGEPEQAVQRAAGTFGRLDILVNNVGGSRGSGLMNTTDEQFMEALDLNLSSAIRASRAAVPHMKGTGTGAIIHIASVWGKEAGGTTAYNVAKAGVISLSKQMARELAPHRIRVNTVAPGSILFPGGSWERRIREDPEGIADFEKRTMPMGFGRPEDVAAVVVFLASERAAHVSGACWVVDGAQSVSNI